jgi:hypothetical protein
VIIMTDENVTVGTEEVAKKAAESAVAAGATEAQVQAAVASALEAYQPRLSDDDVDRIAKAQIKHLEDRGAFEGPELAPEPSGEPPQPVSTPAVDEPPKRKTWAQKFLKVEDS